jgi:hypothetical protein
VDGRAIKIAAYRCRRVTCGEALVVYTVIMVRDRSWPNAR